MSDNKNNSEHCRIPEAKEWLNDFQSFLNSECAVPEGLILKTQSKVLNLLNPSARVIFYKILGIHSLVGYLSLSICHQFGMNPFHTEKSIADWFMQVGGHGFCMLGCGFLFTMLSLFAAGYFLTIDEVRVLKRTEFLQALFLTGLSLGAFAFFGAQLVLTFTLLWILGGLIGSFIAMNILWQAKNA